LIFMRRQTMIVICSQGEVARDRVARQKDIEAFEISDLADPVRAALESADLFLVATAQSLKVLKNAFGDANQIIKRDRLGVTLEAWLDGEPIGEGPG
jgi:hypothetical protein